VVVLDLSCHNEAVAVFEMNTAVLLHVICAAYPSYQWVKSHSYLEGLVILREGLVVELYVVCLAGCPLVLRLLVCPYLRTPSVMSSAPKCTSVPSLCGFAEIGASWFRGNRHLPINSSCRYLWGCPSTEFDSLVVLVSRSSCILCHSK